MADSRDQQRMGRIAREPDGSGFFGHILDRYTGDIVEFGEGFSTVEEAIEWAMPLSTSVLVRLGFSEGDEFAVGHVPGWDGKRWPPTAAERAAIEGRVQEALSTDPEPSGGLEVAETEVRREPHQNED